MTEIVVEIFHYCEKIVASLHLRIFDVLSFSVCIVVQMLSLWPLSKKVLGPQGLSV